jgi:hypothetical protein
MDKWEKVFKYAVYMAYEIVGYARCPDSAAWERTPMKMVRRDIFNIYFHYTLKHLFYNTTNRTNNIIHYIP